MTEEAPGMAGLLDLLDLEKVGEGTFVGRPSDDGRSRVFGGHTIAQALAAASFSVDRWPAHSLHAYFVRPGLPGRPTEYEVQAMRDGTSYALRQVVGVQRDEVVFHMTASFSRDEGDDGSYFHQVPMPETPAPGTFPPEDERVEKMLSIAPPSMHSMLKRKMPVEAIRVDTLMQAGFDRRHPVDRETERTRSSRVWMRARDPLVDDQNLHRCAIAYASDAGALEPSVRAAGASFADAGLQVASLDHALWFHRPVRFDEWLLFTFESVSVHGSRALSRGSVHDASGNLVASLAQEGILRQRARG